MSSVGSSARAGQSITKHHVCGTNGVGEPRIIVGDVEPGSIIRYGIDDDMTCLVVGNFESEINTGEGKKLVPTLLLYGCFCDEPGEFDANKHLRPYEEGKLMTATFGVMDTISVLMEPGMY